MRCATAGLVGERIGIAGLRERRTDALVRIHLSDGRLIQTVLRGDAPFLAVPDRAGSLDVLRDYLALGFEHILAGLDHLLFVLGLVLLVHGRQRLLWTITAFTVGMLAGRAVLRRLPVPWPKASELIPAYAIGSLAALWVFERVYLIVRV